MSRSDVEKEAQRALGRKSVIVTEEYRKVLKKLREEMKKAYTENHRRMLVISGGEPGAQGLLAALAIQRVSKLLRSKGRSPIRVLYMYHDEFDTSRVRKEAFRLYMKQHVSLKEMGVERVIDVYEKTDRYLGTTFDMLVLDLNDDLKPNDVGRLVEIVRGGGLIIILTPPWNEWDRWMTIFKQKLLVPGYSEPRHVFISWFKDKLLTHPGIIIYDAQGGRVIKKPKSRKRPQPGRQEPEVSEERVRGNVFPPEIYELTLTPDQAKAVRLLEKLVPKPPRGKRTTIVITSDRGRGKSSALGLGLVGVAHALRSYKNRVRILVTAPSPGNVQALFALAKTAAERLGDKVREIRREGNVIELKGPFYSIEYWEPIVIPRIKGDIVAVDEASGIHVPQLLKIYRSHDRLVFTATIHGYEGAGRGFSIRFMGSLREDPSADLHTFEMHTPIRYGVGDPIEAWLYDTLLLDAEPAKLSEKDLEDIREGRLEYLELQPEELFTREKQDILRSLFGIYVLAHYRNQPDDLGLLADAPHHIIRAVRTRSGSIVASLQIAVEGSLDDETVDLLLRGNKIPGNIIPDRLLKHLRIREIGSMKGYRIVRIATHPQVQDRGIGSFALAKLVEEARSRGLDWVGSGFGVNYKLVKFWVRNGFLPLHMSPDRNPVSGEYTLIVFKPISPPAKKVAHAGRVYFLNKLVKSFRDVYSDLETDAALLMIRSLGGLPGEDVLPLDPVSVDRLWIYSYGPMTYEALSDVMMDVALHYFLHHGRTRVRLDERKETILLAKVLQGRPWETVASMLGEKDTRVMMTLKEIAQEFLLKYFGKDMESPIGVGLDEALG